MSSLIKMASQWGVRLVTAGLLIFYLLMTGSGYFKDWQHVIYPAKNVLIISIIVSLGIFALIWAVAYWLSQRYVGWLVATLAVLTIPKFVLIGLFRIKPISDMYSYNALGGSSASGDSWRWMYVHNGLDLNPLFPHVIHISDAFGWVDRLFVNKPMTIQFFNVIVTLITAILLYYFGSQIGNHFVGILTALLFYLLPTYYIYSGLLGGEPLWLLNLVLAMLCFNRWRLGHWSISNPYYWYWLILTVTFLILAQLIRPIVLIWAMAFVLFLLVELHDNHISTARKKTRTPYQLLGGGLVLILFAGFMVVSPRIDRKLYHIPFTTNSSLYSLVVGSNVHTRGMYDPELISRLEKINHGSRSPKRYDRMITLMRKQLNQNVRYLERTNGWGSLLVTKTQIVAQSIYGVQLFVMNTRKLNGQSFDGKLAPPLTRWGMGLTTGFQIILITLALTALCFYWPNLGSWRIGNGLALMVIILDGVLLASSLVEVQSRYQVAWYIPMITLAALGMGRYHPEPPNFEKYDKIN